MSEYWVDAEGNRRSKYAVDEFLAQLEVRRRGYKVLGFYCCVLLVSGALSAISMFLIANWWLTP